jgi:transcriptional regulator with XRE-family HTH domain
MSALPEYDLRDQRAAMMALEAQRQQLRLFHNDVETKSGVSTNSVFSWRHGARSPGLGNLVALAQTLGFEIVMRRRDPGGEEYDLCNLRTAVTALEAERRRLGMSLSTMVTKSGVSSNAFYGWGNGSRVAVLRKLVALSGVLGFDVIMRQLPPVEAPKRRR